MVDIWSAGNYGEPRRTARAGWPGRSASSAPTRPTTATSGPIEGLRPVVDLNTMKVIRVEEYGHWPLPPRPGELRRRPRARTSARTSSRWRSRSRRGRASRSTATRSRWQNWSFVIGFNAREGLTLHHLRYRDERPRPLDPVPRLADRDGRPLRRPRPDAAPQERLRRRRVRHGHVRQQPGARLRLPRAHPATSTPTCATSRGEPLTIKNADLHARGGLRHPLEAHRPPPARQPGGAALAAAGRLVGLDGRELRVRLLLVPLPGRQHPVRDQADRHPVARRAAAGREAAVRRR